MGNGIGSSPELEGATPLELALDRATDQYTAVLEARRARRRLPARAPTNTALVVQAEQSIVPARLCWRGVEVSEEFQVYAMRVARGELLAPYRGQVLARPCPEFPWRAPRDEDTNTERLPRSVPRVPRVAVWTVGAGALVMAALGIGGGTASSAQHDAFGPLPTTAALALRAAPALEEKESLSTAIEGALEHVVPTAAASGDRKRGAARPVSGGTAAGNAGAPVAGAGAATAVARQSSLAGMASTPGARAPQSVPAGAAGMSKRALASASSETTLADPGPPSLLFSDSVPF